jgi:hypothetical protein
MERIRLQVFVCWCGEAIAHCAKRAWFVSPATLRLFAECRPWHDLPRRVMGVWWPPRSSKPSSVRFRIEVGSIPTLSAFFRWNCITMTSLSQRTRHRRYHSNHRCEFDSDQSLPVGFYENEVFEGGDRYDARADIEADLAFILCGVSFET